MQEEARCFRRPPRRGAGRFRVEAMKEGQVPRPVVAGQENPLLQRFRAFAILVGRPKSSARPVAKAMGKQLK